MNISRKLIVVAGSVLIVLIFLVVVLSNFFKNQSAKNNSALSPTPIEGLAPGVRQLSSPPTEALSTDQSDNLQNFLNNVPYNSPDFSIGYSKALGEFFIQKKSANADAALNKFLQDNNMQTIYQQYPDLFIITPLPVEEAIEDAELDFSDQKDNNRTQNHLEQDRNPDLPSLDFSQFSHLAQSLFNSQDVNESVDQANKELEQQVVEPTPSNTSGGGGASNNLPKNLVAILNEAGTKVGIAPLLIESIMSIECAYIFTLSNSEIDNLAQAGNGLKPGQRCYTNSNIAFGPMQFTPGTWAGYANTINNYGYNRKTSVENLLDSVYGAAKKLKNDSHAQDPFKLTETEIYRAAGGYNGSNGHGGCIIESYCQAIWSYYKSH